MSQMNCLEEDLYGPVKNFLEAQGFEVRSEVHHCDVTAIKEDQLVIVELKKHLSVDLLVQGVLRQKLGDLVYVAVPKPKRLVGTKKWRDICHLLRRLELGLLLVTPLGHKGKKSHGGFVEVAVDPEPFDREKSRRASAGKKDKLLKEHLGRKKDLNKGGSKGKKLVTAYRELVIQIACCLELCGPLSAKMIRDRGVESLKIASILKSDHYGWFLNLGGGLFELSPTGREELMLYEELAVHYRTDFKEAGCGPEVFPLDLEDAQTLSEMIRVQREAYQIEAELIGFSHIPQLKESAEDVRYSGETMMGCFASGGVLIGFLAYKIESGILDLHRICVDPLHFRKGIGNRLLKTAITLAENTHIKGLKRNRIHQIVVTAAVKNLPAMRFYESAGFHRGSIVIVEDSLEMVQWIMQIPCIQQ